SPPIHIIPDAVNVISRLSLTRPSRKLGFPLCSTRAFKRCIFRCIRPSASKDIAHSLEKGL
ncbi:hypothetical protein PISMIDRAFT_690719, partial [Pisolithus microcarpus 441]